MKLRHVEPNMSYKEQALEFVNEFRRYNSKIHGGGHILTYLEDATYEEWLNYFEVQKSRSLDDERVPDETYF